MENRIRVGCVLMAAGSSVRFGANKLLAEFRGTPLIRLALAAIPRESLDAVVVVTQFDEAAAPAKALGFRVIRNPAPERGVSHTVYLGTDALANQCDGIVYQVADQPLLRRETVSALVSVFRQNPERIIVPFADGHRGNPCIFPKALFPELLTLSGDRGGSQVIRRHPELLLSVQVPVEELADVDTAAALESLCSDFPKDSCD